jgi:hypothetical protein
MAALVAVKFASISETEQNKNVLYNPPQHDKLPQFIDLTI